MNGPYLEETLAVALRGSLRSLLRTTEMRYGLRQSRLRACAPMSARGVSRTRCSMSATRAFARVLGARWRDMMHR